MPPTMIHCGLQISVRRCIRREETTDLINGGGGGGDTSGRRAEKMEHSVAEILFFLDPESRVEENVALTVMWFCLS